MVNDSSYREISFDNAETANTLKEELVRGESLTPITLPNWEAIPSIEDKPIPDVVLPKNMAPLLSDVTVGAGSLTGTGSFDVFMQAIRAHLADMKAEGTLDNTAVTENLLNNIPGIMQQAVSFAVQAKSVELQSIATAEQAVATYWQAVASKQSAYTAQAEAYTARINAQVAVAGLQLQMAQVALTKMQLVQANEQANLTKLQSEIAYTQISDNLTDGSPVAGSINIDNLVKKMQINLMNEQISLYKAQERAYDLDGKIKVTSIWSSNLQTLIANGTLDTVPDCLNIENTNTLFTSLRTAGGLMHKAGIDGFNADQSV